jgi:hypothetical protein
MNLNPKLLSKNRISWHNNSESVNQPSLDYVDLENSLKKKKRLIREDLRKESFYTKTDLSEDDDPSLQNISSDSLIPIPGMLIEYENSESGDSVPMSNWVAPHGPQWGPALR